MTGNPIFSRRFMPLFATQALAALNDNFLKTSLVLFIVAHLGAADGNTWIAAAGGIFMLPFVFLSALGGELADKFDKARLARTLKLFEIAAAAVGAAGLVYRSPETMLAALFLFGVGSALFGPLKYGILPDHLPAEALPKANAWIESATFVAILAGTVGAGVAYGLSDAATTPLAAVIVIVAVACYWASRFIPSTGSAVPDLKIDPNIVRSSWRMLKDLKSDGRVLKASLIASYFWFVGMAFLTLLPEAVERIGGQGNAVTAVTAAFAIAVALGSASAAWLSGGRVVLLQTVVGAVVFAGAALDLGLSLPAVAAAKTDDLTVFFSSAAAWRLLGETAAMAFGGALIAVPSFSAIQTWASKDKRGRVIAGNNIANSVGIVVAASVIFLAQSCGASLETIVLGFSALTFLSAAAMFHWLPTSRLKDAMFLMFRVLHRLEVHGGEHLDSAGPTPVIALNHVSFLDASLAMSLTDLKPVFAINADIARKWWVKPFLKVVNALPLDPTKPMATRSLIRVIEGGRPVAIFPEGRITVTGSLMKVYDGAAMVADRTGALIVPVRIDGLERTHFSRLGPHQAKKRLFPKVVVTILPPERLSVPAEVKGRKRRHAAGLELYGIMSNLVFKTSQPKGGIVEELVRTAAAVGGGSTALEDPIAGKVSYSKLLAGTRVIAERIAKDFADESTIGVMLPNTAGAAMVFFGAMSAGKVPAMINFSAGPASVSAACVASGTKTILTSRAFVAQGKLDKLVEELSVVARIVYTEDLRSGVGTIARAMGYLRRNRPLVRAALDDTAVILFTSGSEGTPKGVVLSHGNILSNAAQAGARVDFSPRDKVFNVLPLFHSFGLTAGLILPLTEGVPVYLYPSPLHYRVIPELIYASNATIIFGTDTFLSGYARSANPYDMRSIRYCFAGAEPVKASTRETYLNKFGIRILEGYGVTEASPVVALNTPMHNKPGTVGKLMPSLEWRLDKVDGVDDGGRLHIKGPNIMRGYYKAETPGVLQPLGDGWHDTGDIVTVDEDGFVTIKGRAKRFAKIGGEMVSLAAVEQAISLAHPDMGCAVVNLPDPKKGERLVALVDRAGIKPADLREAVKARGLTELWVPTAVVVGTIPLLGSGKIDFVAAKRVVESGVLAQVG